MTSLRRTVTKTVAAVTIALAAVLAVNGAAHARLPANERGKVVIEIDKRTQRMTVEVGGVQRYVFRVSTGLVRHETPRGTFRALRLEKMHFSKKYDNAKMPNSIFFTGRGHAIHGTSAVGRLGRRASHGCVRLAPKNAAALYALVARHGMRNVTIRIV